jgi:hypothetical protein
MSSNSLDIVSLGLSALALGWNVNQFLLGGARPRADLVVGVRTEGGQLITWSRDSGAAEQMATLAEYGQSGTHVIGIKVTNRGRAPSRVDHWTITGIGGGVSITPYGQRLGPPLPHDLAPGSNATWVMDFAPVQAAAEASAMTLGELSADLRVKAELGTGKVLVAKGRYMP